MQFVAARLKMSVPTPLFNHQFNQSTRRKCRHMKILLWLVLLFLCWPLALIALVLYPIVWVLLLPFRLVAITVGGVFALLRAVVMLPARLLRG